jgi:hypothetical protein
LAHPAVHEASHAVAAIQRGIEITEVRVVAPDAKAWLGGVRFAGRVIASHERNDWVHADPLAALEYLLAGSAAESELLGHSLPGSGDSDIRAWRKSAGFIEASQIREIEQFLGSDLDSTLESTHDWVTANAAAIRRVAARLQDPHAVTVIDAEWRLTSATIRAIIDE